MKRLLRVGIVGCGTAGPALGIFLQRAGHEVVVLERVPDPQPVGAGLLLQPTGLHVLNRLGLLPETLAAGDRVERLVGYTPGGWEVMNLGYGELIPGLFALGIHRGALADGLFKALRQSGAEVRCGVEVESVGPAGPGGRSLRDRQGQEHGPFDLVVVADGTRSRLRPASLVKRRRAYAWAALWFIGEDRAHAFGGELYQVYRGTRRLVGLLPTGRLHPRKPRQVSLFWSLRARDLTRFQRRGIEAWKEEVRQLTPRAEPLLEQIGATDDLIFASYFDVVMRPWHQSGLLYIGDAAHAMSPQLGQGANLALVDALVLAQCIDAHNDLEAALASYLRRRRRHVAFYQHASRWLTPLFQSSALGLGPLRDLFVPLAAKIPAFRRQSLLSMVGVKDGWLSCLPLDETTDYLAAVGKPTPVAGTCGPSQPSRR